MNLDPCKIGKPAAGNNIAVHLGVLVLVFFDHSQLILLTINENFGKEVPGLLEGEFIHLKVSYFFFR